MLRYLEGLGQDHQVFLISFEKRLDWQDVDNWKTITYQVRDAGIVWYSLNYHKSPTSIATLYDVIQGILVGFWVCVRYRVKIVHARSYVAAVMALALKKLLRIKFLFDMRGFWADERLDGGIWA